MTKLDKEIQEGLYDPKSSFLEELEKSTSTKERGFLEVKDKWADVEIMRIPNSTKWRATVIQPINRRGESQVFNEKPKLSKAPKFYDLKTKGKVEKARKPSAWLQFVKAHSNMRTAKGLLDLKAISKLWKEQGKAKTYDKDKATVYVVTDAQGNKRKATYAEWLKWMKEQKKLYDPKKETAVSKAIRKAKARGLRCPECGQLIYTKLRRSLVLGKDVCINCYMKAKQGHKLFDPKPLALPPTRWYEAMVKGIKRSSDVRNPYAIVKNIWTKLTSSKKAEIKRREAKGERFKYDLPLPVDKPTRGTGTVRMVKPFKLAEVQVNLSVADYLTALKSGIFSRMKRQDGTTALVARCKSPEKNVNVFIDKGR